MQNNDLLESLSTELLMDIAQSFFGSRKCMDETRGQFENLVTEVRERNQDVLKKLCLLHHILGSRVHAEHFYRTIGLREADLLLSKDAFSPFALKNLPNVSLPFAITVSGKYTHLVDWAYEDLAHAIHVYMNGEPYYDETDDGTEKITAHYHLIRRMCTVINQEAQKLNQERCPGSVLQYVRGFNPGSCEKERILGSGFGAYTIDLNQKLAFRPIDFATLNLSQYPLLPQLATVTEKIRQFCKTLCKKEKNGIQARLYEFRTVAQ